MAFDAAAYLKSKRQEAVTGRNPLTASSVTEEKKEKKNKGGLLGGLGYTLGQLGTGIFGVGEGIYDFVVGGIADIIGQDEYTKRLLADDITGRWQEGLNDWYNPSSAMQFVGDVAGGLGQTAAYVGLNLIPGAGQALSAGAMFTSAAGRGVTSAYKKTGKLGAKEWLYGLGSGTVEAGLELATGTVGKIAGSITGASKSVAKTAVRSGILRSMWDAGKGEFVEEALSEFIDPYLQKATIDPNAKNASLQEIIRAGAVGFVSGAVGGAAGTGIGNARNAYRGNRITKTGNTDFSLQDRKLGERTASSGSTDTVLQRAQTLLSKIDNAQNAETVAGNLLALKGTYDAYNNLTNKNGIRGQMLLGEMARNIAYTEISGGVEASKADIKQHADTLAQYLTDQKGQTYTAEDIKNNKDGILTDLAIADFSAKMIINPDTALAMVKRGEMGVLDMASQYEAWRGNLTAEQLQEANTALGIDLSASTFQDFNKAMGAFNASNQQQSSIETRKAQAQPMPDSISLQEGETAVYKTDSGEYLAVKRDSEGYLIAADDANGNGLGKSAKHLTEEQVNELAKGVKQGNTTTLKTSDGETVRFSQKSFADQIDALLNGQDTQSTHLRVSEKTPQLLLDIGLTDKPMLITSVHTKTALGKKERSTKYRNIHNISEKTLKKLPSLLEDPAIIMDSTKSDSIVCFVNAVDNNNNPILCAIKIDGKGNYNNIEIETNLVTSVYGKDTNPIGFIEKAVDEDRVLYWNKKMSQDLFETPELQLPDNLKGLDSNVIIHKSRNVVNTLDQNSSKKVETSKVKEIKARFETAALTEEGRSIVKDFDNLPASTQARIREMIATGQKFNSVSKTDMEFVANLMAKRSGVSFSFTDFGKGGANGLFTTTDKGKRFIQLNASNSSKAIKVAAVHELAHELRKSNAVGYESLSKAALKLLSKDELEEIKTAYTEFYKQKDVDTESKEFADLLDDEYQAHAMQKLFGKKQFLERYINYDNKGILEQAKGVATKLSNKFKGVFFPAYRQYDKLIKTYEAILAMPSLAEVVVANVEEGAESEVTKLSLDKGNLDDITRLSIPLQDSNGNTLTEAQRNFFKDSKVRDKDGNLLVVYHGTNAADFTEFKRNVNFFTDSIEMADSYSPRGEKHIGYLNITNPFVIDAKGERWSRVPVDAKTKTFLEKFGASVFKENGQWRTSPADIAYAVESGIDEGLLDYDGIIIQNVDDTGRFWKTRDNIVANDYITFKSNQFKNTTNQNPTENPDIRYSIPNIDNYTKKQYNDFGWVRANDVVSASAWKNFDSKLMKVSKKRFFPPKATNGEWMISVSDESSENKGIENIIVFAKGTYQNPKVSQIIKINFNDETSVDIIREYIYERKGTVRESFIDSVCTFYAREDFLRSGRRTTSGQTSGANRQETSRRRDAGSNQEDLRLSIPTKIDSLSVAELEKLSDEEFNELYDFFGIDDILAASKDTDVLPDFSSTWDDISVQNVSKETKVEPKKIEILFKRKGLGNSHIARDKMAVMSNERLNREIDDSGAMNKTYARSYITRISPTDFIDLTVASNHLNRDVFDSSVGGDSGSKMTTYNYAEGLKQSMQTPYLHINKTTGQIIGHNGRHRMRALEMAGIESAEIVVSFFDEDGSMIKYDSQTLPKVAISSQFDTKTETNLYDVIPLNEAHRDEIFSNYGERGNDTAIRYSISYAPTGKTAIAMTTKEDKRNFRQAIKESNQWARIHFVDAQAAIVDELKALGVKDGEALVQAARAASSSAQQAIGGYIVDVTAFNQNGKEAKRLGKGIDKVMQPVRKAKLESEFFDYLFNLHNIDRLKVDKPVNGNTEQESREIIQSYEAAHPEFIEWQKDWAQMVDALMTLRLNAGLITQETYDYLKATYPHYVPTFREEGKSQGTAGDILGKYDLSVKRTLKKATGSTDTLIRPDEMIARQTLEVYRAIAVNNLIKGLYDAGVSKGSTNLEVISREKMGKKDAQADGEEIVDLEKVNDTKPNSATNSITFFKDGEKITLRVSKNIFTGFDALHPSSLGANENWILKGFRTVMNVFKSAVTNWNPTFLIRNAVRDLQDAGIYTKNGVKFATAYPRAWKEMTSNGKLWQLYVAAGGMSSSVFDTQNSFVAHLSERGFAESDNKAKKAFQKLENFNVVVEQMPRFTEFIASIEAGKSVNEALLDSADVTVNFGRSGIFTKFLNTYFIPFFNAAVQGASKTYRTFVSKKTARQWGSLLIRCAILGIAPALFNNILFDDDEEYQNLRTEDKQNYYLFKVGDKFIKLPRGRIAALLAGATIRTDMAMKGEEDAWDGFGKSAYETLTPIESSSRFIWSPFQDVKNNVTWYGSAIEGREFENKAVKDRYDESTSSIAIWLGKSKLAQELEYSPKKIHYLVDQYAGVIGDILLPATTKKAEKGMFSGNFTIDPITSNKLSTKFYKIYDETNYAKNAGDETAALKLRYLNKVKASVSELYKEKDAIQASNLSDKEKLLKTKAVQVLINEAYKNAVNESDLWTNAFAASEGLGDNYTVVEVTKKNYKSLQEKQESIGSYVIAYNGLTTGKAYATEEKAQSGLKSMISDYRFVEGYRLMQGTEAALMNYSDSAYEKAKSLTLAGIDYDNFYNAYFYLKQYAGDATKKREYALSVIESLDLTKQQRLMMIYALGYSVNGELWGMSSKTARTTIARYINSLRIKKDEKIALAQACGLTVKNGKIVIKS